MAPAPSARRVAARTSATPRWRSALGWLLLLVGVLGPIAVSRIAFAVLPIGPDQGLFTTIGEMINRGGVPWRDAWENKPPVIYYLYAAVLALAPDYSQMCTFTGRPFPVDGLRVPCAQVALSAFDALYQVATAAVVGLIGRRLFGRLAGGLAAVLYAVYGSMSQVAHGGMVPDLQALLPAALAYGCAVSANGSPRAARWLIASGAFAAMALLTKQNAGIHGLAIPLWLLLDALVREGRQRFLLPWVRRAALFGAGALSVLLAVGLTFGAMGALPFLVDQTLLWFRYYAGDPANAGSASGVLYQAVSQTWKVFSQSQAGLWLAAGGGVVLALRHGRRDSRVWLVVTWLLASAVALSFGGSRFYQYYYVALVPPCALLGGWALARAWQAVPGYRVWLAATAVGVLLLTSQLQASVLLRAWYTRITSTAWTAEEFVAGGARRGGSGSLFVWGNGSQVYALSGRRPASRYLHTAAVSQDFALHPDVERNRAELMEELRASLPAYIAVDGAWLKERSTAPFPALQALIAERYQAEHTGQDTYGSWELWRRKDLQ